MPDPERAEFSCEECEDLGWVLRDDGGAGSVRRCDCHRRRIASRLLDAANIPERYADCTLDGFRTSTGNDPDDVAVPLLKARGRARRYVDELLGEDGELRELGLLFVGPPGVGKTHLAVAVLSELIRRYGVRGRFVDFTTLVHQIQATFDPGSPSSKAEILDPVAEVDLLVLDELGAQKPTEWVQNVLYLIINERYVNRRPTLFTTNYRLSDDRATAAATRSDRAPRSRGRDPRAPLTTGDRIGNLDTQGDPLPGQPTVRAARGVETPSAHGLLAHRISPQLISRLYEMAETVKIDAVDDYRHRVKSRERHLVG